MEQIIDAHVHLIPQIDGIKRGVKTSGAKFGKISWKDEEIVFLPPYFKDTVFPPESLVEIMNQHGVSKAVLLQNPVLGIINNDIKNAIARYPDRFAGTIQVDPMKKDASELIKNYASIKQHTLKLEISEEWGWSGNYPGFSLLGKEMLQIWKTVSDLKLNVIIDTGDIYNNGYQIDNIKNLAQTYPETKILIEHLGFFRESIRENIDALQRRTKMLSLATNFNNVYLGFSSVAAFIDDDYPCCRAIELLKEAVEIAGSFKILWGSDIPSTFKKYTYQQMIDVVSKHSTFLSEDEKHQILYQNANDFFFQYHYFL